MEVLLLINLLWLGVGLYTYLTLEEVYTAGKLEGINNTYLDLFVNNLSSPNTSQSGLEIIDYDVDGDGSIDQQTERFLTFLYQENFSYTDIQSDSNIN